MTDAGQVRACFQRLHIPPLNPGAAHLERLSHFLAATGSSAKAGARRAFRHAANQA